MSMVETFSHYVGVHVSNVQFDFTPFCWFSIIINNQYMTY